MHWRRKWQPTPVFCLENPREGGAWWAAIYGVTQSRTGLKQFSSSNSACEMPETIVRSQKGAKWGLQPPLPLGQEQSTVLNIFICKRVLWLKYWVGQKVHLRFSIMVYGDHCLLIETTVFIQAHYVANEETKYQRQKRFVQSHQKFPPKTPGHTQFPFYIHPELP